MQEINKTEEAKNYKKNWWKENAKKYKRITLRFPEKDYRQIEELSGKLQRTKSEIIIKATQHTLNQQKEIPITHKEDEENKQVLLKQTLIEINRIGTNINQIARNINERRLERADPTEHNLTRSEKNKMLEISQKLEDLLISLINQ